MRKVELSAVTEWIDRKSQKREKNKLNISIPYYTIQLVTATSITNTIFLSYTVVAISLKKMCKKKYRINKAKSKYKKVGFSTTISFDYTTCIPKIIFLS